RDDLATTVSLAGRTSEPRPLPVPTRIGGFGGVEGLVHISKLSWDRIGHPQEVFQVGQQVQVKIDKVNQDNGKISLSYRDTFEHPWQGIEQKYPVGSTVKGTVSRIAQFGAFVRLEPGVEGLIHISELAHHRVVAVKNHVKEGDEVEAKVLTVDGEGQKMGLSLKALVQAPQRASNEKAEVVEDDTPRESIVPKRAGDLKGGRDRESGGDRFGLNW
ncbi:MAG TPA: S1 RNA-binding domain-containing protein, partial [Pirellulaceae bacterium]|nr:S1 RNA-binding domain-containing protein [Pirellulaceae bacterium]